MQKVLSSFHFPSNAKPSDQSCLQVRKGPACDAFAQTQGRPPGAPWRERPSRGASSPLEPSGARASSSASGQETAGGRHLVSKTAGEQAGEGSGTPGHKVRHSVRAWRGFPLKMTFKGKYWGTFILKIKY